MKKNKTKQKTIGIIAVLDVVVDSTEFIQPHAIEWGKKEEQSNEVDDDVVVVVVVVVVAVAGLPLTLYDVAENGA